ncbi:glycosyltransferase family 4 protein [Zavarzinia compransoris]|uniref:glycosyltransferase family 4 protein n=1 Tax=Zavarzinia compransoris TaxID=1264899 RepID=UPI0010F28192|nr:glycosyltransferase family 4 protein [Zavarzinia compransoris]TDP45691.1 glycosyltransferase involved in cell wall biosynthesis [Zavarzinia compransoris]
MNETGSIAVDLLIESTGGGSARHVLDLFDQLLQRGHSPRLIYSMLRSDSLFQERLSRIDPARAIRLDMSRSPHLTDLLVATRLRKISSQNGRRSQRLLHAHSTKAGFIASMVHQSYAATIFTPHAYRGMDPTLSPMKRCALATAEHIISRSHNNVIAVSPDEEKYALRIGVRRGRLACIPNGVDPSLILQKAEAGRVARCKPGIVLGFVGRLAYQKNPLTFLECVKLVHRQQPHTRGVLFGDGPMDGQVRSFIATNGLGEIIDCPGQIDFVSRLHDIDIMVHTSRYESLPYVFLEACAVGMPIVSVRNAGSETIFPESRRLIGAPSDAKAIAADILRMMESEDAMKAARKESLDAVKRFSITVMVDAIEKIYRANLGATF